MCTVLLLAAVLSGCRGSGADGESVRTHFDVLAGFEAHLKILCDLDQSVLEYEMDYVYNKEDIEYKI